MVTPELKWPMTNLTPSPTILLATDTPCLGSEASSPNDSSICWPLMPPLALMSAAACSAPFLSWAPNAALGPVSGPATPILICADAPLAHTQGPRRWPALARTPSSFEASRFNARSRLNGRSHAVSRRMIQRKYGKVTMNCSASSAVQCRQRCSGNGPSARQPSGPRRRIQPAVLDRHLARPRPSR